MSEFIGSRISLISKSDIRYVGTLHEINSENSTVALENVSSFGTEGRKSNPAEEVAGSDSIYEYIVFRGSDVKDLRIEEPPQENRPPQLPTPNDPAILSGQRPPQPPGAGGPPPPGPTTQNFNQPPFPQQQYGQYANQGFGGPPGPGPYGFNGPPPPGRGGFGGYPPYGPPGGPGGPHAFHHDPPPPLGRGFPGNFPPPPGPFSPTHRPPPFGGPGPQQHTRGPSHQQGPNRATPPAPQKPDAPPAGSSQPTQILKRPSPEAQVAQQKKNGAAPPPPNETKPTPMEAVAPPATAPAPANQAPPPGLKPNRIVPAMPLASPAAKKTTPATNGMPPMPPAQKQAADAAIQQQNANTQAATAAVAAAMAKLGAPAGPSAPPKPDQARAGGDVFDNLSKKVSEMRVDASAKGAAPTNNHLGGGFRGRGRGRGRGGPRGIEVPQSDFDFSNAKFDKDQLTREASAGVAESPAGEVPVDGASNDVVIPPPEKSYDANTSFFDNISSEARDREVTETGERRGGGREFRAEDRRRNMETFGIGSVDGGYRGGFRGRGRGRGFRGGFRGRARGPRQQAV